MINGPGLLQDIVVRIYLDADLKTSMGTGFFLKDDQVITCYHVLQEDDGSLRDCYYVKPDATAPIKAWPIKCFKAPIDIAVLQCSKLSERSISVVIKPWDNMGEDEFLTRGYDIKTPHNEGANSKSGTIVSRTTLDDQPRLQLRTEIETLLQGRSGSPVWSERQRALVGMVDYRSGKDSISSERSFAIPLEVLSGLGFDYDSDSEGRLFYVPPLPPNFIPRSADLKKAKEAIISGAEGDAAITGTFRSAGLQGMGGIGKSVLAAALTRDEQVRRAFKDGIVWIGLGQQADLLNSQIKAIRALDPDHGPVADISAGRSELERISRQKHCLLILDDVWRMEQLWAFDGLGPECRMLFTTRDQAIVRNSGAKECRLGVLSDEESLELLRLLSGREELPEVAQEVAEECDNLPLALAMVGAMLKGRPDDRWENVLHKLRSADLEKIRAEFRDYPYPNLMRAIEVSTDNLNEDEKRLYLDLAVFAEDELVPEEALQVIWNRDQYDTQDLIDLFVDRSLATLKNGRLSVHDLQHDFMIKRAGKLQDLHDKLLEGYRIRCQNGWPSGPNDGYFFQHLAYHLSQAGRKNELKALLLDLDWMQAKLWAMDVSSLLSDYDQISSEEDLSLVQGAIRLSAHVLFQDPRQLPSQLAGRLLEVEMSSIKTMIEEMPSKISYPWLRPLTEGLTPPGGPLIRTFQGHADGVWSVAISADGLRALSGSDDNTLKLWDIETGKEIRTFTGHTNGVISVAISSDGRRALSGSGDNTLKLWDIETGKEIKTFLGHTAWATSVAISADGRRALSGSYDQTLKLWDIETGKEIRTFRGHTGRVYSVALSFDGRRALSGSDDNTLKLWDIETGKEIRTFKGHVGCVWAVAISSDGRRALSGSYDQTLKLWDIETGREIRTFKGHAGWVRSVVISSDGRRALSGSYDQTLKLWDIETGKEIRTFKGHTIWVISVVISSDGRRALSGSYDRTLKLWDIETGKEIRAFKGHADGLWAVAILADGRRALSGSYDQTLKLWDIETGREIKTFKGRTGWVWAVAILADGRRALSGSYDHTLKLWDIETGQEIRAFKGHVGWVWAVAISSDGRRALSGSYDHTLKLWDIETGREIRTFKGHAGGIRSVVISSDGRRALSGSDDNTLKLWDIETGREIRTFKGHASLVLSVAISSDGRRALSGSYDHTLKLWDIETGKMLAEFSGDGPITAVALAVDGWTIVAGEVSGRVHFLKLENA